MGVFSNLMGVLINFLYGFWYLGVQYHAYVVFPEPGIWIPYYSPLQGQWDLLWSRVYPARFFGSPDNFYWSIYFLNARLDLFLYNYFGSITLLILGVLLSIEGYWLRRTLGTNGNRRQ
jgi:hypothetical protein